MNATYTSALAVVAGVAIGATSVHALYAQQAKAPPAYYISNIEITDPANFPQYAAKVASVIDSYHGRFLARGGKVETFAGEPPNRIVVIAFDSMADAAKYRNSAEFHRLDAERDKVLKYRQNFAVEGVPDMAPPAVGSSTPPAK